MPSVVPGALSVASGGFDRTVWYKGERLRPRKAYIWLDGGNTAVGTTILGNVRVGDGELHFAPDGLVHNDNTSTWIKSWTPEDDVLATGADRDTDLQMLVDVKAEIASRWPTITAYYLGGYSGGGGMTAEHLCRGFVSFDGHLVFKRPLHESQVDTGVAILETPRKPLLLWLSTTDTEHNDAADHVGLEGTVDAYKAAYGVTGETVTTQRIDGFDCIRHDYEVPSGEPAFTYIEQQGGGHAWVRSLDSTFRNFLRLQPQS